MKKPMPFHAVTLILIVIFWDMISHAFAQSTYKVGVPVSDTIDTQLIINNAVTGGCDYPQDNLWFRLTPSLIPYVTGLSFQIVITEANGRVWSSLSDTVKAGDAFYLLPTSNDSGVKIFLTASSSYRFITRILGTPTVPNETYYCEIKHGQTAAMCANSYIYYGEGPICQVQPAISVEEKNDVYIPAQFQLLQNYPNSFNAATTIAFDLPRTGAVNMKVFSLHGVEVANLTNQQTLAAGRHRISWSAEQLPSGIYVCQIRTNGFQASRRLLLLR